jgi:hypothetical protein
VPVRMSPGYTDALPTSANDWQWKQARLLVTVFDLLVFETLNIKAMHQLWGRKVGDLGFADFLLKTQWMATKLGKELVKIDPWEQQPKSATSAITASRCRSICGPSRAAVAGTWKIVT